jgi:hypothetical protein
MHHIALSFAHTHCADCSTSHPKMTLTQVCFNLGYLPGTDKKIITETDVTMRATEAAMQAVEQFGCVSLTCYTGDELHAFNGPPPSGGATGELFFWQNLDAATLRVMSAKRDIRCTHRQLHFTLLPELSLVLPCHHPDYQQSQDTKRVRLSRVPLSSLPGDSTCTSGATTSSSGQTSSGRRASRRHPSSCSSRSFESKQVKRQQGLQACHGVVVSAEKLGSDSRFQEGLVGRAGNQSV